MTMATPIRKAAPFGSTWVSRPPVTPPSAAPRTIPSSIPPAMRSVRRGGVAPGNIHRSCRMTTHDDGAEAGHRGVLGRAVRPRLGPGRIVLRRRLDLLRRPDDTGRGGEG